MGQIATQLIEEISREAEEAQAMRRTAEEFTKGLPFDLPTVKELAAELSDPQHVLYVSAQQFSSAFAEQMSVAPEFAEYDEIVQKAEDEYLPDGPPKSPLTRSFFTTWAFFDVRFGADRESIGTCLLELLQSMNAPQDMLATFRNLCESRMGIYEHVGSEGSHVRLRELITGDEFVCYSTSGYQGHEGELWYFRRCPPITETLDYHIVMTTPYVLIGSSREDWTAFLNRSLLDVADKHRGLHELLKYGSDRVNWNEFVFQAFHRAQYDAIFLTGIPDVPGSLPHSPVNEAHEDAAVGESFHDSHSIARTPATANEPTYRMKLTAAQRQITAELSPKLAPKLKLTEPHARVVELTDAERLQLRVKVKLEEATSVGPRKRTLRKLEQTLLSLTAASPTTQPMTGQPRKKTGRTRGQWVFEGTPDRPGSLTKDAANVSGRKSSPVGKSTTVYQFRIELEGARPLIWRRIQVADCSLEALHLAVQGAMGWCNSHLYEFEVDGVRYSSMPQDDFFGPTDDDLDSEDATAVRISELAASNGKLRLRYTYDFGDSWEHIVTLEKTVPATAGMRYPMCVDGARACPPEDCGGIYGYFDLVEALTDPAHPEHEDMLEWNGSHNPEAFDSAAATKAMRRFAR